jgi:sugar phosphate isomerase/epimerase
MKIYLGTVALEPKRWSGDGSMVCRVSEWLEQIAAAGFDGIELWENHGVLASESDRETLRRSKVPVTVLNSYVTFDEAGVSRRHDVAGVIRDLGARAVKFNVSRNPATVDRELDAAVAWGALMPGVGLWCECHGGTPLQEPRDAARLLATRPEIGVIVHAFSTSNLDEWIRLLGPRIVHVHSQHRADNRGFVRLREIPDLVRERVSMLKADGFGGSITIEFTEGVCKAPENLAATFAATCDDLAFLREAWREGGS